MIPGRSQRLIGQQFLLNPPTVHPPTTNKQGKTFKALLQSPQPSNPSGPAGEPSPQKGHRPRHCARPRGPTSWPESRLHVPTLTSFWAFKCWVVTSLSPLQIPDPQGASKLSLRCYHVPGTQSVRNVYSRDEAPKHYLKSELFSNASPKLPHSWLPPEPKTKTPDPKSHTPPYIKAWALDALLSYVHAPESQRMPHITYERVTPGALNSKNHPQAPYKT